MSDTVGIIGVGNMGLAMALRLRDLGCEVRVCDIDPARVELACAAGAIATSSPAALAEGCGCVIVAVVDAFQAETVLFGTDGAAATLAAGGCVMLCPTIGPGATQALGQRLQGAAIDCIDAPMSGGPARARDGTMSLMVACTDDVFERWRALIGMLSDRVFRVGSRLGDGARTKLVNNLLAAVNLGGAAEALALAARLGLDVAATQALIEQSSGQSWIGSDRMRRALVGDFVPRAHTALLQKDSALAVAMAADAGFEPELGRVAAALFAAACAAGCAKLDDASLLCFLDAPAGAAPAPLAPDGSPVAHAGTRPPQPITTGAAAERLAAGETPAIGGLDGATAAAWARCALESVARAYPYALQRLTRGDDDRPSPREVHPIFGGSYDWHSSVHMHWSLVRLLRLFPELPQRAAILARFGDCFTADAVAIECRHLELHPAFERPYGWGWLMRLHGELLACGRSHAAAGWAAALAPMVMLLRDRWLGFLGQAQHPQRAGNHANSAFAMTLALVAARERNDVVLATALERAALDWFGADAGYPAQYEPGSGDFLSGGLCEAMLMSHVLARQDFGRWWQHFAPAAGAIAVWLEPLRTVVRADPQLVHGDGLNLSRAWCLGRLAEWLPQERGRFAAARQRHLGVSLPHVTRGDFVATHWLVSFALLAQTEPPGESGPL